MAEPTKRKTKRKRRIRSPHPGVKLKRRTLPSGATSWRAIYTDPDSGREVYVTLDPDELSTAEARTLWAKNKASSLARRRMDRAAGIPKPQPAIGLPLERAIKLFLDGDKRAKKTIEGHELAFAHLRAWAKREAVVTTADLTPARIASLRRYVARVPRKNVKRGGKRGARAAASEPRSPVTINRELRSIKTLLNTWRTEGHLVGIHRDDIRDNMKAQAEERPDPAFLRPAQLQSLLEAALAHDAATFEETREEHAGRRPKGTTPRYVAIAPFVAFVLLTGMRRKEALAVPWSIVDLDALDHEGRTVGEIRLTAKITKTRRDRTIGLEVSPALRAILAAMRDGCGGKRRVFDAYTVDLVQKARLRMIASFDAPADFDWKTLRSTCSTYLTSAPGIFGGASIHLSARQLGHSVKVAERHYLSALRGIPHTVRTLEAAMQIEGELSRVLTTMRASGKAVR